MKSKITNLSSETVKTGLKNTYGNKGYIISRFEINDTSIAVCSAHLHGKYKETKKRFEELSSILNSNFNEKKHKSFQEHDLYFIIGDLNFKNTGNCTDISRMINEKNYSIMANFDEFLNYSKTTNKKLLKDTIEGRIYFNPTYQFIIKTNEYDKMKIPSWYYNIIKQGVIECYLKILII